MEGFKDYRVEKPKVELLTIPILLILNTIMNYAEAKRLKTRHES